MNIIVDPVISRLQLGAGKRSDARIDRSAVGRGRSAVIVNDRAPPFGIALCCLSLIESHCASAGALENLVRSRHDLAGECDRHTIADKQLCASVERDL